MQVIKSEILISTRLIENLYVFYMLQLRNRVSTVLNSIGKQDMLKVEKMCHEGLISLKHRNSPFDLF